MTTSSRSSACTQRVGGQHAPPGHQFCALLRIQRHLARIAVAVGISRCVAGRIIFVGGAERVQQLVRDHDIVRAVHLGRRKCVDHADETLGKTEGMRHRGREPRVVEQHEHAYVLGFAHMAAHAPGPVPELQAPEQRWRTLRRRAALRRPLLQFGAQPRFDRVVDRVRRSGGPRARRTGRSAGSAPHRAPRCRRGWPGCHRRRSDTGRRRAARASGCFGAGPGRSSR